MNIIETAKSYAIHCHQSTNHLYDEKPYEFHLQMVYEVALSFIHLVPENDKDNFLAACWVHDVIEDCRQTYSDVLKATNKEVAELAYALTNEKGKNRKERANEKYYREMKRVPHAVLLKVCDRIANVQYSMKMGSRMFSLYAQENNHFSTLLSDGSCEEAFAYLNNLFVLNNP
jgi:(p)ppGpp synthase/HD superfamily hydrolase